MRALRASAAAKLEGKPPIYEGSVAALQSRNAEVHCARPVDPLIAHDFETQSLALIQAGNSCAFEGAYTDQHVNSTVLGPDETIALEGRRTIGRFQLSWRILPWNEATSPQTDDCE